MLHKKIKEKEWNKKERKGYKIMTRKMKKYISGAVAGLMLVSSCAMMASASFEEYLSNYEGGAVHIYMNTANRAWWSDRYVYAYDREFDGMNLSSSGSIVKLLGQSWRSETGWITQDSWALAPGASCWNVYTWAKTHSEWRVHLRTTTDRYDSYAHGYMFAP